MNNPLFEKFREISWRRALTDAERTELNAWLETNPEFRAEWEAEMGLSASLARLPEPAVPSNFTARVLQEIERETPAESRSQPAAGWWQTFARKARWMMGTSFAAIAVILGFAIYGHQVQRQ